MPALRDKNESPASIRRGSASVRATALAVFCCCFGLGGQTLAQTVAQTATQASDTARVQPGTAQDPTNYTADGRLALPTLMGRFETLSAQHGWQPETIYVYPGAPDVAIKSWHTPHRGEALWILSGIHGEEPAGPNAIAANLASLVKLAEAGVPIVVIPLANPNAYRRNWRYPNTPERDWKKGGGYSVGDAEHLLPDLEHGTKARSAGAPGPETSALTQYVLRMAEQYPPRLVLDLHEDELSTEGGYIYSQGRQADGNPVGAEIVRLLQATGIPLRQSGKTRFDETIVDGVISRDDRGGPIRDGSIDELLAATEVFVDGKKVRGPSAHTVIVVETPAFAGSKFDLRVAAQGAVLQHVGDFWRSLASVSTGAAPAFHDQVLGRGSVTLPLLRELVGDRIVGTHGPVRSAR